MSWIRSEADHPGSAVEERRTNPGAPIEAMLTSGSASNNACSMQAASPAPAIPQALPLPSPSHAPPDTDQAAGKISVVIADRNPVFLHGLASVLQAERDFVVVASCQDEAECIAALHTFAPSLALLDMSLSDFGGFQVLAAVRAEAPATRVVFMSSSADAADAARAFSMGASGVVPKDGAPQSLVWWLRQVMSGQQLALLAVNPADTGDTLGSRTRGKRGEQGITLTVRERQIAGLVSTGLSNREVGERLRISEGTIKVHLNHIFKKLSIRNRTALANLDRDSQRPRRR